jgi:hypothetical protein
MHERMRSRAGSAGGWLGVDAYLVVHGDFHCPHFVFDGRVERVALEEEAEVARHM